MNIQLSELKKMIKEEIEDHFGTKDVLLESPEPENKLHSYRGVNFSVPSINKSGEILSEGMKLAYTYEMQNFIDSFFDSANKK